MSGQREGGIGPTANGSLSSLFWSSSGVEQPYGSLVKAATVLASPSSAPFASGGTF